MLLTSDMAPRSRKLVRSLQATVLAAVAWVAFALPMAFATGGLHDRVAVHAPSEVLAVPVARSTHSTSDPSVGRGSRAHTFFPWLGCRVSALLPDVRTVACVHRASTPVFARGRRVAAYDATAPPARPEIRLS